MNILYTVYREPAHQTARIMQRFLYVKGPHYKRQKRILNQTNETENTQKGTKNTTEQQQIQDRGVSVLMLIDGK